MGRMRWSFGEWWIAAYEFGRERTDGIARPERWESPPEAINRIPGVWSNVLTFLNGNRACIGYRFALAE